MLRATSLLSGLILFAVVGCGQNGIEAPDEDAALQQTSAQEEALTVKVVQPTQEMLAAAREGKALPALTAGTCNPASTCPSQYASCTNWSSYSICNEGTCGSIICRILVDNCYPYPPYPYPATETQSPQSGVRMPAPPYCYERVPGYVETSQSYRVCFDPANNACTEFRLANYRVCDCY